MPILINKQTIPIRPKPDTPKKIPTIIKGLRKSVIKIAIGSCIYSLLKIIETQACIDIPTKIPTIDDQNNVKNKIPSAGGL